ncbi:hypothetical protein M2284_002861 [Rhodococcus sp. LBL1]|nr:hypothetical protein [Rhodococcus sp. LBL1]MDH6684474.1 hypothetical protein [Rhodococcus sp. LBL2]
MSHFTCLVITNLTDPDLTREQVMDEVDRLMAPFDETRDVEPYDEESYDAARIAEMRERDYKYDRENRPEKAEEEIARKSALTDYQFLLEDLSLDDNAALLRDNGDGTYTQLSTYNPMSHWDWYSVGGRWEGFPSVEGGRDIPITVGRLSQVDRVGEALRREKEAGERYDKFEEATKGLEVPASWEAHREHLYPGDINAAQDAYNSNPWVQAAKSVEEVMGENPHDLFKVGKGGREEYVRDARLSACTTSAMVTPDGKWHPNGQMGWFGMSSGDDAAWPLQFQDYLDGLDEDYWFAFLDLHI